MRLCTASFAADADAIRVPLHLFVGARDRMVSAPEVVAWRWHSGRGCEMRVMPGGHFFMRAHEDGSLCELAAVFRQCAYTTVPAGARSPPSRAPEPRWSPPPTGSAPRW
jgi:surfactin synthase thioesterase subunit